MRLEEGLKQNSVVQKPSGAQIKRKIWQRRLLGIERNPGKYCRKEGKRRMFEGKNMQRNWEDM